MKKWICAVTVFLLGCGGPTLNPQDSQSVVSAIKVQRDDFKKVTNYTGPDAGRGMKTVFIRAMKLDKDGQIAFQIYVDHFYSGDWRFYNETYDSNGKSLATTRISRDVVGCAGGRCSHREQVGIDVTRDYLEQSQESGIYFKLSGKGGEDTFQISGAYIRAMLSVVK